MGAVILTILKIIGITLAVLVGLILLIVLLVGFVPVRYKAAAEYPAEGTLKADVISQRKREALKNKVKTVDLEEGETPEKEKKHLEVKADAVVSWLLHIVHVRYSLDSTGSIMTVRLFGLFKIYSNDPKSVKKKEEKRKKKEEKKRKKAEKQAAKEKAKKGSLKEDKPEKTETEEVKEIKALETEKEEVKNQEAKSEEKKTDEEKSETVKSGEGSKEETAEASETDKDKAASEEKDKDTSDEWDAFDDDDEPDDEPGEKKGIVGKLKGIYGKLSSIFKKIKYVKDMKDDERVRSGLSYGKKKLFLIIKRVLPKKVKGRVAFGMDDPATTGYIMGGVCLFYRHWRGHFLVEPDFEKKRLEADVNLKGRIVLAMLVIPAVKVWFNKDIKHIRRRVDKLKKM